MFNTYHAGNTTNSVNINAVTGAILKNHSHSWFERFHLDSERARRLLKEGGHQATKREYDSSDYRGLHSHTVRDPDNDIIVLQMVICGDMEVMAELVYAKDYEVREDEPK